MKCIIIFVLIFYSHSFSQSIKPGNSFFERYGPNYFTYTSQDDLDQIEFLVSIRYPSKPNSRFLQGNEVFFSYTGLYDFYIKNNSEPVVSRLQNTGLHYRYNFFEKNCSQIELFAEVSGMHESNGQSIDDKTVYDSFAYNSDGSVNNIQDNLISLSSWYVGFELGFKYGKLNLNFEIRPRDVYWVTEDVNNLELKDRKNSNLQKARRFRFRANYNFDLKNYSIDHEYFSTRYWGLSIVVHRYSFEMEIQPIRFLTFPLAFYFGTDNANEISTYYKDNKYIRFGIDLL